MHRGSIGPSSDQVTRVAFDPQVAVTRAAQRQARTWPRMNANWASPSLRERGSAPALAMVVSPAQVGWALLD